MHAIESEYPDIKDVLPKTYNRFENSLLKELLKTMNSVPMDIESDPFGKIYEYFLSNFARAEGPLPSSRKLRRICAPSHLRF